MALTPPPPIPQRGDRTTFSSRVDAFLNWEGNTLVPELSAYQANLNAIAAGGAYAMPFVKGPADSVGKLNTDGSTNQNVTTVLGVNNVSAGGADVSAQLQQFDSSSSVIKGQIRIQKLSDPSKFIVLNVTGRAPQSNYQLLYVTPFSASSPNPFVDGDLLILFFQRTGDKGDPGNATPVVYVRNQLGNGTAPQTFSATTWNTVQLNNIPYSTISGVTVSAGVITGLPAGTYWVEASSPCLAGGTHQARLFNVTDNVVIDNGTSERNDSGTPLRVTRSFIRTAFTIASTKSIRIEHWVASQTGNGSAAASGAGEIYGEIRLLKVA